MYKVLALVVSSLLIYACSEPTQQPLVIVKAHQKSLDNGDLDAALNYWEPTRRKRVAGAGFEAIASMFTGLTFESSSIEQSCKNKECRVVVSAKKEEELLTVTYFLAEANGTFYISNIQSKSQSK